MVGTPAPVETFSASIMAASGSAWRNRSGMINEVPASMAM